MNAVATITTVTAIGLLLLSGCGGSVGQPEEAIFRANAQLNEAMFRGNAQHTGVYNSESVAQISGLKWKFKSGEDIRSSPTVVDGVAYFAVEHEDVASAQAALDRAEARLAALSRIVGG